MTRRAVVGPDPEDVRKLAGGARAMWGERAAEGCRTWGREARKATSRAEWNAAAELLEAEDREKATT